MTADTSAGGPDPNSEPERDIWGDYLTQIVEARADMLQALRFARPGWAVVRGEYALDHWLFRRELLTDLSRIPTTRQTVMLLTQAAGLFGDLATAEFLRSRPVRAARHLATSRDLLTRLAEVTAELAELTNTAELPDEEVAEEPTAQMAMLGMTLCRHGLVTTRPHGRCQKQPCPGLK